MHEDAKALIQQGDQLFTKKQPLLNLWQEIADQFYPERADFTVSRGLGSEFADHLMTSYPVMARRDLGNSLSSMLRPSNKEWFYMRAAREEREDNKAKRWLEWATGVQRRAMQDRNAMFARATKEGDHDFATFGQTVISVELTKTLDQLIYRCWHLRDCAWCENDEGKVDTLHRKWKPTVKTLMALEASNPSRFAVHDKVRESYNKGGKHLYEEVNCRHIMMPAEDYDSDKKWDTPYVSIYVDVDNQHVMEAVGSLRFKYVVPRWQTVSGSQYAHSPATIVALPDARLIQSISRVLLESGEKYVDPPMLAVQEAIRSDISMYAGGITWVDSEYDERLGEVLRPLTQDKSGVPMGMELQTDIRNMITEAFYLNKLGLPPTDHQMTAYETGQRVQEYIRQAMPLFEPMDDEYNGGICEETFGLMLDNKAFGPHEDIPDSLRGEEVQFRFESPLNEAIDRKKGQRFQEVSAMLAEALQLDQSIAANVDIHTAFRDAIEGMGAPANWIRSEETAQKQIQQQAQMQQMQQVLDAAGQTAQVAKDAGEAEQAMRTGTEG